MLVATGRHFTPALGAGDWLTSCDAPVDSGIILTRTIWGSTVPGRAICRRFSPASRQVQTPRAKLSITESGDQYRKSSLRHGNWSKADMTALVHVRRAIVVISTPDVILMRYIADGDAG